MFHSKGFRLNSEPESLPPPLFYNPKPPASWHADVLQSIKRWFTMCCGNRTAHKTSDAAVRTLEEGKNRIEEDCEPLIEGGMGAAEKREALRLTRQFGMEVREDGIYCFIVLDCALEYRFTLEYGIWNKH
ncbi:uncharacterized protein TRIVIDRAFT_62043 [Trichoderma virens Gv29-8]|uniref:Uncharacterized protein n=1 Tax=Hypocrea virens (strain Gv29-8 / FGSC 10586) TaxID=413071 RepID=G9MIN7_HYPVG|nr:uncharacterized protein TRIVIDRAFT_62043 [Trichoderma virens Gv29-8]EHK25354.1 hypothetical protein TRIVIDRAFT_62043 [Trichoderma virens Gv29-8]UKZ48824.1 hypothetical protein TrVGV298_003057 [Trichoderma virens]